ncbi:MAG TPA: heat-shock protein [Chromatiaceae bacterium]|jgi:molecular chaperone IbpA|nr:MAG: heat-shock protein [Thiohalocapsa sp. PB-PSB1]QQO56314.1 MAG: Hsp20 family protein [Thiohalocapsa sp. PB-PSB1]HBG95069.1 heat-shock protein [Chromatiaceae bacterium]HCS89044.1 heat-shock protein [Chromatiaceae bacterium]
MTTIDFSPLLRSMIGFDRMAPSLENAFRTEAGGYPPYNLEVEDENKYRIVMAVAGFAEKDLSIESKDNMLTIAGSRATEDEEKSESRRFLYRGIATRSFERKFQLADYVKVVDASLKNGLLHIDLVREVPEAMKPRRIEIRGNETPAIEGSGHTETKHVAAAA